VQQIFPAAARSWFWPARPLDRLAAAIRRLAARRPPAPTNSQSPPFALGLQGGGAFGAFTWGVLDRLVEMPGFRVAAMSGASAGAANAAVFLSGWLTGGADGAKAGLHQFWRRVGHIPSLLRTPPGLFWLDGGSGRFNLPALAVELATSVVSPYEFNPFGHNPLRAILADLVDFERLRRADAPRIYVSATDVEAGRAYVFDNSDLSLDAVLASTCLPHLFPAVEIGGRHYWDGGFTANPPIGPLCRFADRARPLLVLVNPTYRAGVPRNAADIATRLNQILGNANLLRELDALRGYQTIELADRGRDYGAASKYNNDSGFIEELCALGRRAADEWIAAAR
jgi:NTE family protein